MWKLVIEDDEGKRTVVPLTRDLYTIGRKEGNTIRLTERNVSRDHAKVTKRNGQSERACYVLEDLTSYNGVYVNGLRVAHSQELAHGDLIQVGDYRIVLQDDAVTDAPAAVAPMLDPKATVPSGAAARNAAMLMERPNRLVMLTGPTPGAEYPLDQERLTVGRAEDATISVNHNSVSRLHCEIHALGDGRFEIVDKGSSNGVRVNAAELRRGIIEAGDVIELGDVKFKFVGAGQIFRPGASESQQLSAITDRTASMMLGPKRSSSGAVVPLAALAFILVAGGAAAWYFTRDKIDAPAIPATTASAPIPSAEQGVLDEAKKLCGQGSCDAAHEKLKTIAENSPLRTSQDFKDVEAKWADSLLSAAETEPDLTKRRQMLTAVSQALTVDPARRKAAADRLDQLDTLATNPRELPVTRDAGARFDAGLAPVDAGRAVATADAATTAATASTAATPAVSGNDFDKSAQLALQGGQGRALAKKQLEAKVYGGRATTEEIRLLKQLCREADDRQCVETCKRMLGP